MIHMYIRPMIMCTCTRVIMGLTRVRGHLRAWVRVHLCGHGPGPAPARVTHAREALSTVDHDHDPLFIMTRGLTKPVAVH